MTYCAESSKTFLTDKRLDWIKPDHYHEDSQVKLDPIEKQWVGEISLYDDVFGPELVWDLIQLSEESDSLALEAGRWLCNESCFGILRLVINEVCMVLPVLNVE